MMRISLFIIALFCSTFLHGQSFTELLERGKKTIKSARSNMTSEPADYTGAIRDLEQAVKLQPDNAEAHYFLGSAYDYNNNPDGSAMRYTRLAGCIAASKEFETVNRLSPHYTGEIVTLDPHTKLSSIWGGTALSYLCRNKTDSAKWAFAEGKKRGGFTEFALGYYRTLLNNCTKDAIYFSFGDFSTMSIWYLQCMENLRTDVIIINLSMSEVPWYTEYVYRKHPTVFSSAKVASDTTPYFEWTEQTISVPIKTTGKVFQWTVKATVQDHFIYRSQKLLIDIVKNNKFRRSIYFEKGLRPEDVPGLYEHLKDCFLMDMVVAETKPLRDEKFLAYFKTIPFGILNTVNPYNTTEMRDVEGIRYEFIIGVSMLLNAGEKTEAKKLLQQLAEVIPPAKFPYLDENTARYIKEYTEAAQ